MIKNNYWILTSKEDKGETSFILELTPDGIAYIWTFEPKIPKVFRPLAYDQDPDDLLIDGDFVECQCYFHGITDFMDHSKYKQDLFEFAPLGAFDSIRSCRASLSDSSI